MKWLLAVVCCTLTLSLAAPANAEVSRVNAALAAVAWDAEGVDTDEAFASCAARVLYYGHDPFVILTCQGDDGYGEAWVRVKVPGVRGHVTGVSAGMTGDCSPRDLRWRKTRTIVLVTISVTADTDCQIRAVRVRYE